MRELKFMFVAGLIPLACIEIEIATFAAVVGVLVWLLFFSKSKGNDKPKGNSKTDE
jgi:hypothetical protein